MDESRQQNVAYEYLCHLEETKLWLQACIKEDLPSTMDLEESLRNGVFLAKLAHFFAPDIVPVKKIFDLELRKYRASGLHFRHTDNINYWLKALKEIGLPVIFYPETTDIYEKKNMPRTIYCLHALSLYLFRLGKAPQIQNLYGKVNFTEEEINAMHQELQKYGISMPQFQKIGGLLANEMPVDEAALHAAIIAINEAVEKQVAEETLLCLKNQGAFLQNIHMAASLTYQTVLYEAKKTKVENFQNRSLSGSYVPDVYDELLTQAEIQGHINTVNVQIALDAVWKSVKEDDVNGIVKALKFSVLNLKSVKAENSIFYMNDIGDKVSGSFTSNFDREGLQMAVYTANEAAEDFTKRKVAVKAVNKALDSGSPEDTLMALRAPVLRIPSVQDFAAPLYHEEMGIIREYSGSDLTHDDILGGVRILSTIASINKAVSAGNIDETWRLMCSELYIQGLEPSCKQRYQSVLLEHHDQKMIDSSTCPFLTHLDIQECVDKVNAQYEEANDKIIALHCISEAVRAKDREATLEALLDSALGLLDVSPREGPHYLRLLQLLQQMRSESTDSEAELWLDDIQDCVNTANRHAREAEKVCASLAAVNLAVDQQDIDYIFQSLISADIGLQQVSSKYKMRYQEKLGQKQKEKKSACKNCGPWIAAELKDRYLVFLNMETMEYSWETPADFTPTSPYLNKKEIVEIITSVNSEYDRKELYKANEELIVNFQACIRGYLTRKKLQQHFNHFHQNLPAILRIQAWWRGVLQRRSYLNWVQELKFHSQEAVVIQSSVRMWLTRKKYIERCNYYKQHENEIIKLQARWRSCRARHDFQALINSQDPPLAVVRKFVHLLNVRNDDFEEELQLQSIKGEVVKAIRHNQQLEQDLDRMDIKIGLLVQNRITLQDVMAHGTNLNQKTKDSRTVTEGTHNNSVKGWKTLTKGRRKKLDAYQHIFYLLQTNPTYLAKLIFAMPQGKTNKFMESVIMTLYNYGSNVREEYLLLKLFKTALEEEIRCKVDKTNDIISGNPMVIKMIVSFNRNRHGQSSLRDMLGPLIKKILDDDKNLQINTNPVEVYKSWVNQLESQTGHPSGLPYIVNQEQALQHEEVQRQLQHSIQHLKQATLIFLYDILHARDKIPYGMLYMSKVLRTALKEKFPMTPEKDILKVVGNLLYYRFINSAIVAPDAFDIVNVSAEKTLTGDQRRNLGSIAKILQFAASKKGFGEESPHLTCLNPFIIECHEKFKQFFQQCCDVEEPEIHFSVDQYYEATLIAKPTVYITLQELCDTHQLLLDHEDTIAPDPEDPLHELLEDLGSKPSVSMLLGTCDMSDETVLTNLGKTEVCLTLCNKFEVEDEDQSDAHRLFISTKQLLLMVLPCTTEDSLPEVLTSRPTAAQEKHYEALLERHERTDQRAQMNKSVLNRTNSFLKDHRLPLTGCQEKICQNLYKLELAGYVQSKNGYQSIISAIARDIRNHRRYRHRRKQELQRLRETKISLDLKTKFYEDQVDYYNQYIRKCLENLSAGKKKVHLPRHSGKQHEKVHSTAAVRYSAAKLHEKGIILKIEGLPAHQFKNVMFEICPTETGGVFEVNAKFMGVGMEKVDLDIQHLLQLQYEGVAVINMFEKAKINVNLLLFFLNSKFYGKSK